MKIPDDVFETRCRYCMHGRPNNGNADIPDGHIFSPRYEKERSCDILGVCQCDKVEGECLSFTPLAYFGTCMTCRYSNCFVDGFCTKEKQPNKHQLFLGHSFAGATPQPQFWGNHCLSTCDNYHVTDYDAKRMIKAVSEGRSPANFNPDTLKPIKPSEKNKVAEEWLRRQEQARLEQEKIEKVKLEKSRRESEVRNAKQISLFDLEVQL